MNEKILGSKVTEVSIENTDLIYSGAYAFYTDHV